jgi:hypothetical protein
VSDAKTDATRQRILSILGNGSYGLSHSGFLAKLPPTLASKQSDGCRPVIGRWHKGYFQGLFCWLDLRQSSDVLLLVTDGYCPLIELIIWSLSANSHFGAQSLA